MILKWYCYYQSNSGGKFIVNDNVAKYVLIQARSAEEANRFAEGIGIYFDGACFGYDCPGCGDRWHRHIADEAGSDDPQIFGQIIEIDSDKTKQKEKELKNNYRIYSFQYFKDNV